MKTLNEAYYVIDTKIQLIKRTMKAVISGP